jgi:inner membrane protein
MHNLNEPKPSRIRGWLKQSLSIKILSIGLITMLLMIPNSLVKDLIRERNYNQQEVVREVSSKWGKAQNIVGPVLTIPYKTYYENKDGEVKEYTKQSHFLPEFLNINGTINPENRKRGLYNVVLYQTNINCDGWFKQPNFKVFNIEEKDILWDQAFLQVSIPDMSGINDNIILNYGDDTFKMESGIEKINGFQSGVKIPIAIDRDKKELEFRFGLDLNGSHALQFGPIGKETNVQISSSWNSPSFLGAFLPDEHTITEDGFAASWKILDLNRNYPQSWVNEEQNLLQSTFGLKLMQPVDEYAKNTRSAKYALLVITLTFLIFFFFEIINKQKMHPMHYILVGLAISIFYILLLSLSEHIGFNLAYILSAWAVVGLIGIYTTSIVKSRYLVLMLAGILASIFGFIFIILQLEDFALLAGSIGLFVVLAIVMYYSRNIDWNKVGKSEVEVQPEME